jgi:hypothetical protein
VPAATRMVAQLEMALASWELGCAWCSAESSLLFEGGRARCLSALAGAETDAQARGHRRAMECALARFHLGSGPF